MRTKIKSFTLNEVADMLRLSRSTVYKLTSAGKLPCFKISGKLLYLESDLEKLIELKKLPVQAEKEMSLDEQLFNIKRNR